MKTRQELEQAQAIADEIRRHVDALNTCLERAAQADVSVMILSDKSPPLPDRTVNLWKLRTSIAAII